MEKAVITIQKSFFHTAGKKYGWSLPKWACEGVGIDTRILQNYTEIEVIVDNIPYLLNCEHAIAFIRRFKSIEDHKGIKVGIISRSLLKRVSEPEKEEPNSFPQPEFLQSSLF